MAIRKDKSRRKHKVKVTFHKKKKNDAIRVT